MNTMQVTNSDPISTSHCDEEGRRARDHHVGLESHVAAGDEPLFVRELAKAAVGVV